LQTAHGIDMRAELAANPLDSADGVSGDPGGFRELVLLYPSESTSGSKLGACGECHVNLTNVVVTGSQGIY
jgi:hypothetical protein